MVTAAMKLKDAPWKKSHEKSRQLNKKQRYYFANDKQEMARMNVDILEISKLKWTGMGEFKSDDHYLY